MRKINRLTLLATLCCLPGYAVAAVTLGEFSNIMLAGGNILTKVMWAACIVVGIALIAAAFTQFQIHRRNPKLVPLTTPVMYLILGIAAISIPFIEHATGFLEDKLAKSTRHGSSSSAEVTDIDAPLN